MNRPMITRWSERSNLRSREARFAQAVRVVGEQHERREAGRADRVALRHGLRRVADRVERVGDVAHFLRQLRHLGDAAGVVGDRAERVERDDHAGHRQHARGRDCDAVEPAELVCAPDREADRDHGQRGGLHRHAEARDDVRRVARLRRGSDLLHRAEVGARVVLGDHDHRGREREADQRGAYRFIAFAPIIVVVIG